MARRRRTTRRRNSRRTVGALVLNPRRRRNSIRRRNTSTRRRNTRRRNSALYVLKRRNARRRSTSRRRRPSRRRNALIVRNRRRRSTRRRRNYRKGYYRVANRRRRNPVSRRRNSVRRRNGRRRNPVRRRNGLFGGLSKIPVIGPALAFLPHSLFGALSVEPSMWLTRMIAPMMPTMPAGLVYAVAGLLFAGLVQLKPIKSILGASNASKLAVAAASAGGGVAYYKWRMGDHDAATEVGMLELRGFSGVGQLGDGLARAVQPMGAFAGPFG